MQIVVQSNIGKVLRVIELANLNKVVFYHNEEYSRIIIRAENHYDLVSNAKQFFLSIPFLEKCSLSLFSEKCLVGLHGFISPKGEKAKNLSSKGERCRNEDFHVGNLLTFCQPESRQRTYTFSR